jgi:hypothetical protein
MFDDADSDPDTQPDDVDADDSHDAESAGSRRGRLGTQLGDALGLVAGWLVMFPIAVLGRGIHESAKVGLTVLGTVLPFFGGVWQRMVAWSLQQWHKKAGGDAIGLVVEPNGKIEPTPVKYKAQSVEDEDAERAGWHEKGGSRTWHEGADGREVDRLGKTPVVWLDSASTQRATTTEARFAQCLDLDRTNRLVQLADEGQFDITVQMADSAAADQPLADGGMAWQAVETSVQGAIKERALVDIGSGDHDGMRLDPRKVKETYREKTGGEQLDEVERLGFLAGLLSADQDKTGFVIKVLLIALGFVAAALVGPDLMSQAGSAGGSTLPIMLGGLL